MVDDLTVCLIQRVDIPLREAYIGSKRGGVAMSLKLVYTEWTEYGYPIGSWQERQIH